MSVIKKKKALTGNSRLKKEEDIRLYTTREKKESSNFGEGGVFDQEREISSEENAYTTKGLSEGIEKKVETCTLPPQS